MGFSIDQIEIGYHQDCKWHTIPCDKGPDCKHFQVKLCNTGEFLHASLSLPIAELDKKFFRKPEITKIISSLGKTPEEALNNLIARLNEDEEAA